MTERIHFEAISDWNESRVEALLRELAKRDEIIRKLKTALRRAYVSNTVAGSSKATKEQPNARIAIAARR
jgi:hypothetical protein